jgi:AraC-like DNA-binding protein
MKQILDLDEMKSGIFGVASISTIRDFHAHKVSQLSIPINGVMYIMVQDSLFIIPPGMAIFIPKNTKHRVYKINPKAVIDNVYFTDIYQNYLPNMAKSFYLSTLAAEVIAKICTFNKNEFNLKKVQHLISVLLDELNENSLLNYSLTIPKHPQLFKIYELFAKSIDYFPSITDAANLINVSNRTLQRLFKDELGVNFVLWKQQFIFIKALELLIKEKSTTIVAYKLGYNSDSAFISMFKKMSGGKLPSSFFNTTGLNQ